MKLSWTDKENKSTAEYEVFKIIITYGGLNRDLQKSYFWSVTVIGVLDKDFVMVDEKEENSLEIAKEKAENYVFTMEHFFLVTTERILDNFLKEEGE